MTTPVAPTLSPASAAVERSAAQELFDSLGALWRNLTSLQPEEFALNLAISLLIMIGAAVAVWGLTRLLHGGLARLGRRGAPHEVEAEVAPRPKATRWTGLLLRLVVFGAAVVLLLSVWGLDLLSWLTTGSGVVVTRLAVTLLLAAAAVEVVGLLINRATRRFEAKVKNPRRAQQVHTLAPLLRGLVQGLIVIIAGLTLLSELGVQIGPLLASAGVVGVAVGFGAQTIVKDLLTGFFLVVEDIVTVGDNVSISDSQGTVEAMTLRTIRLRAMSGTLHIFPYSEAQVIHNHTKTFSAYLFEIPVDYSADVDKALDVMAEVGRVMRADPAWAKVITDELEVMGVDKLTASEVVLKARFKTLPREQWKVGREYNRRLKPAFDAAGISSPLTYTMISGGGAANDAARPLEAAE